MAVGSIFAEFDLDYTKFDKNRKKLEASATATITNLEKQWDNLTEKQMDEYGQMVAYVKRKHEEILADTKMTAQEQARAYTVAADRMKRINAEMAYQSEATARQNQQNADWWLTKMRTEANAQKEVQGIIDAQYKEEMALNEKRNRANAEWWMAKRKHEENAQKEAQGIRDAQYKEEVALNDKRNRDNAEWWMAKRKHEENAQKEVQGIMDAQYKEEVALNEKRNRANADWWMAKRKFDEDAKKKESANYDALGLKSKAYYDQRKAEITSAYKSVVAAGDNEERVHKAYRDRMKAVDREYAGQHSVSMAGMVRSALALYAAYYVVSQVVGTVVNFLKSGLEVADQMKTSAIAVAASITTAQGNPENYRKNYEYASALVVKLREVDKVSFATYENILLMNRAMELQGVHLDMNNKTQMSVFTSLTNAVALYTSGQDQAKQAAQEFRSIFSGNIKAGSEVAKIIDTQAKASGKYANGLKDILKQSNGHKEVLERIQPFLIGIEASVKDISKTWESATTSLQTSWDRFKMTAAEALFPNAAQDIKDLASAIDTLTPKLFNLWESTRSGVSEGILSLAALLQKANAGAFKAFEDPKNRPMYDLTIRQLEKIEAMQKANERRTLDFQMKLEGFTIAPEGANLFDYTELKKVESVYGGIYTYVKGIRETPETGPGAEQIAENLRQRTRDLASQKEAAKDAYEEAIRHADQMAKLAIKQGQWEMTVIKNTHDAKTSAAETYRKKLTSFAEQEIRIESQKAKASEQEYDAQQARFEKMSAVKSEIKRAEQSFDDDMENKSEAARQRTIDETAKAYELIGRYSKEAADARIADINREYDARASSVKKSINEAARAVALSKVAPTMSKEQTDERMSILGVVAPDSVDMLAEFRMNLQAQADLMNEKFEGQAEREQWLTMQIVSEYAKRDKAVADYYANIEGYGQKSYEASLRAIESTRIMEIAKGMDSEAANRKAADAIVEANNTRFDSEHKGILSVVGATKNMFGEAKSLMNENSRAYRVVHNAEMAMKAVEIAIEIEKQAGIAFGAVQQATLLPAQLAANAALAQAYGVTAIIAQGTDPITGPARMAAMAAVVGGLLSIIGIGMSMGRHGSSGEVANPNVYATGTGTLLGSTEASQSATNIATILKDAHASEYSRLTGIYQEVRSLNDNITGLVRGLVVAGGDFSGAGFASSGTSSLISGFRSVESAVDKVIGKLNIPSAMLNTKLITKLAEGVFGGDKEISAIGRGIRINGANMGDILSGASASIGQFFTDMKEVTDGGWFHSDKTRFWTTFSALDADTNRLLNQVFANLGGTVLEIAEGFGVDVTSQLENYAVNIGKIDLMGKSADEISKELTSVFSAYGDRLVTDLFGNIVSQYQKINEGMMETAVRLVNDMVQVENIFRMTRINAEASVDLSESLIKIAGSLDELKEAASTYYDAFFSDAEKASDRQSQLSESLAQLGYILPGTRQGFRDLVEGTRAMTATNQEAYVSLLNMAGMADEYYSYVEEKQEEILSGFKSQLTAVQNALKSFTTQTSDAVVGSIEDIIRRTRAGISVPGDELSAVLSAATSTSTEGFSTGLAYDLNRARNAAALRELESVTSDWISTDEAQLAVLEQQAATLDTLTALTAQTATALAGDDGTVVLLNDIKGLLTNSGIYVKRISDNVDEINETGVEIRA